MNFAEFESMYQKTEDPWLRDVRVSLQEYDERYLRILRTHVAAPARILEIACGTGYFSNQLADTYAASSIDACDISKRAVEIARRKHPERIHFYADSMPALVNARQQYDLVVLNEALNYLSPPERLLALSRIRDLITPGGFFFIATNIGKNYFEKEDISSLVKTVGSIVHVENNYQLLHYRIVEIPTIRLLSVLNALRQKYPGMHGVLRPFVSVLHFLLGNRVLFQILQGTTHYLLGERGITNMYFLVARDG